MTTPENVFVVIDTTFIQTNSLAHFMGGLGYERKGNGFETKEKNMSHIKRLSYSTAVQLHNLPVNGWVEDTSTNTFSPVIFNGKEYRGLDLHISGYGLQMLQARRLVKRVKLVSTRKGGFKVQSNMVKPQTSFLTGVLGLKH